MRAILQLEPWLAFQYVWDLLYYVNFGGDENGKADNPGAILFKGNYWGKSVTSRSLTNRCSRSWRVSFVHSYKAGKSTLEIKGRCPLTSVCCSVTCAELKHVFPV